MKQKTILEINSFRKELNTLWQYIKQPATTHKKDFLLSLQALLQGRFYSCSGWVPDVKRKRGGGYRDWCREKYVWVKQKIYRLRWTLALGTWRLKRAGRKLSEIGWEEGGRCYCLQPSKPGSKSDTQFIGSGSVATNIASLVELPQWNGTTMSIHVVELDLLIS